METCSPEVPGLHFSAERVKKKRMGFGAPASCFTFFKTLALWRLSLFNQYLECMSNLDPFRLQANTLIQ